MRDVATQFQTNIEHQHANGISRCRLQNLILAWLRYLILSLTLAAGLAQAVTFDFDNPAANGNGTSTVTQAVSGITMTVTKDASTFDVTDLSGASGTSGLVLMDTPSTPFSTLTFSFNSAVDLTSLRLADSGFNNPTSLVFTPTGGSGNTPVNAATVGDTTGNTVTINWSGITSFTVTKSGGGTWNDFVIDNLVFSAASTTYTVTYNGNGNTGGSAPTDSTNYASGATVTALGNTGTLTKTGYTFAGWNTQADGNGTDRAAASTFSMPASNTTLYAKWTPVTYTVTYNGNGNTGGSAPTDSTNYASGATVTVLNNSGALTKTGYTFAGWNTAANGSGTDYAAGSGSFTIGANTTLYAKWTANAPSATTNAAINVSQTGAYLYGTVNDNGHDTSVTYDYGTTTGYGSNVIANTSWIVSAGMGSTTTDVTLSGLACNTTYHFRVKAVSAGGTAYGGDQTFTTSACTIYTVTYDGNGSTGGGAPTDGSSPYASGATVTVLGNSGSLVRTGYTFAGWNTAANGSGTDYAASSGTFTIGANTTLYAKWTPVTYTVTYDGNTNDGGSAPTDGSSPYASGATVTALTNSGSLTKTGYTFAGWNTQADGNGSTYAAGSGSFAIGANTTLYAKWNDATPPTLPAAGIKVTNTADPHIVELTFSENLASGSIGSAANWTVTANGGSPAYTVAGVGLSGGNKITLTLAAVDMADSKTFITNSDANGHLKVTPPATVTDMASNAYAAGLVTEAGATHALDSTAPTLSSVSTSGAGSSGGTLNATASEKAKGYWIAVASGAAAPSVAEIKAGVNYGAVTVVAKGSGTLPSGTAGTIALSGLAASTAYDIHVMAEDAAGNAVAAKSSTTLTTTAAASGGSGSSSSTVTLPSGSGTVAVPSGSTVVVSGTGGTVGLPSQGGSITLNLGNNNLQVSANAPGTTLGFQTTSGGTTAPTLTSGSATLTASSANQSMVSIGSGTSASVVTSQSPNARVQVSASDLCEYMRDVCTTMSVESGSVSVPKNCGEEPQEPSYPGIDSPQSARNQWFQQLVQYQGALENYRTCSRNNSSVSVLSKAQAKATRASGTGSMTLYKGETASFDASGVLLGVTLADGGAGLAQTLGSLPPGIELASTPVTTTGTPSRLSGADLADGLLSALSALLGSPVTRGDDTVLGGLSYALPDGTVVNGVPVGSLQVIPNGTSSVSASGQASLVTGGVAVNLAPTLNDAVNFSTQLRILDAAATATIAADGVITATVGGARYTLLPSWASTASTLHGISADANGNLIVGNGAMQQTLHPAFADFNIVRAALATIAGVGTVSQQTDGSVVAAYNGTTYTLRPGYGSVTTSAEHANEFFWHDDAHLYLNYMNGTSQAFTLQ